MTNETTTETIDIEIAETEPTAASPAERAFFWVCSSSAVAVGVFAFVRAAASAFLG